MDATVGFILTTATGDEQHNRPALRRAVANALGRQENLVIEDRQLDMSLLIGSSVTSGDAANPASYEQQFLHASYAQQGRHTMGAPEVFTEIQLANGDFQFATLHDAKPGDTLVIQWQGEVFAAYHRLFQTNRWTKRNFPYIAQSVIDVPAFLAGWRAHGGRTTPDFGGPVSDDPHPLLTSR
jgi:hypothetical protein